MKYNREYYMDYFKRMENRYVSGDFDNKMWIDIVFTMYDAIYKYGFFTRNELSKLYPILLKEKEVK